MMQPQDMAREGGLPGASRPMSPSAGWSLDVGPADLAATPAGPA